MKKIKLFEEYSKDFVDYERLMTKELKLNKEVLGFYNVHDKGEGGSDSATYIYFGKISRGEGGSSRDPRYYLRVNNDEPRYEIFKGAVNEEPIKVIKKDPKEVIEFLKTIKDLQKPKEEETNEAVHVTPPIEYEKLKIGDTLKNQDGSPWTETEDGKKIIVLNRGIAMIDDKHNYVDIFIKDVLGNDKQFSIAMSNLKEIAKNL